MSKKVGILFSGGLDSTYLVWKNLKDGNRVTPIYVEVGNNYNKTILEKNRIELLHKEFDKEFPFDENGYRIKSINVAVKIHVNTSPDTLYFHQMPIWMFALMYCQSLDVDELQIGYIGNDDAISYVDEIQKMYKSYEPIFETMKPLVFPLIKTHKFIIAQELPKQYMNLIVSCENVTIIGKEDAEIVQYEPCGNCVPCRNIIASNYYGLGTFPEYYKKAVLKYHTQGLQQMGYKVIDEKGVEMGWHYWHSDYKVKPQPYQMELIFDSVIEVGIKIEPVADVATIEHTITISPASENDKAGN